jgi:hypothetical protein
MRCVLLYVVCCEVSCTVRDVTSKKLDRILDCLNNQDPTLSPLHFLLVPADYLLLAIALSTKTTDSSTNTATVSTSQSPTRAFRRHIPKGL